MTIIPFFIKIRANKDYGNYLSILLGKKAAREGKKAAENFIYAGSTAVIAADTQKG